MLAYPDVISEIDVVVVPDPYFEIECPLAFELNVANKCNLTKVSQGYNFTFEMKMGTDFENIEASGTIPSENSKSECYACD